MAKLTILDRRSFLKATGLASTGLVLQATLATDVLASPHPGKAALALNLFVSIEPDDSVNIIAHRSEMGQGIRTSLPQIVADEMEADWRKVNIVQAIADEKYGNQDTDGSRSVRTFFQTMREIGAAAKLMLRQAAAQTWQVKLEECVAIDHTCRHTPSGRVLRFGELAAAAAALPAPAANSLIFKAKKDYQYIGKPVAIVDLPAMVSGATQFGIDTELPGMVYASIERTPVMGGKVKSFDASAALKVKGVLQVVEIAGGITPAAFNPHAGIAVVATNTWAAQTARKLVKVEWDLGAHRSYDSAQDLRDMAAGKLGQRKTLLAQGDTDAAFSSAARVIDATYSVPHLEHATMEPPAAVARISGDRCEVWACVQSPVRARDVIAGAIGFKPEQVTVNVTLLGGGFGRKSKPDFAAEAALIAKAVGKPVKVTWTREDAIKHGYYHASSVQTFAAALDKKNQLMAIKSCVASPTIMSLFGPDSGYLQEWEAGQGFSNLPYNIENQLIENAHTPAHTRIGWMRSVFHINHAFGVNSFFDELAREAKQDAFVFHQKLIGKDRIVGKDSDHPFKSNRLLAVMDVVKKSCGWPHKAVPNQGWGLAQHYSFFSYVAVASKVTLKDKALSVEEVHIALDCGQIVNPDRVHSQMEGAVIFALSLALYGDIAFKQGAVVQSNFHDYPLLRMDKCPKIVVTLIDSDEKHTGVGEPGVPPVAPSITNAIVAAGGPRIRQLPINRWLNP
ncbi:molybdopterin-dependent oxidoreductase [Simiduia curdlanivorans]|uniref:Molybdopterin cofactor-binding domain-containing protein n=1 Tax=Simiduia curdlanivorans TaxID=1492769 RepID=A0ABV8V6R0_9GAMM|nr:molybdopterin cofactor-binding domain-containing protein [Simiduia curdlanivorans]MDN3640271.1 molybdopterin-dependent oxidoreductase [Simiduia curdlanivorans]